MALVAAPGRLFAKDAVPDAALPDSVAADFAPPPADADHPDLSGDPYFRDSLEAQRLYELAVAAAREGNEDHAVPFFLRASKHAEAAREWYLAAVSCHKAGNIFRTPEPPYDLWRAFRIYQRAIFAYDQCGHYAESRALAYEIMRLKVGRGRELGLSRWVRAELTLFWLVSGFGQRPQRVLGLVAVLILLFALYFWAVDGVRSAQPGDAVSFWDCVYFSGITFATVGFGDFLPVADARFAAMLEGVAGAFTMSFFVVVLSNRLRH